MTSELLREYVRAALLTEYSDSACRYESTVIKTLKVAGAAGHMKRAACSDANRPDADLQIDGEYFYVEVKSNSRAQMGGGSVGFSLKDRKFYPVGLNRELSETISELLNDMKDTSLLKGLKTLMQHLSRSSDHVIDGVPMSGFSAQAWEDAKTFGLLQAINRTFESDVSVIAQHYARKNTHYIQIGGRGCFRLSEANPANLPLPVLSGRVQLEVRVAKAGDTGNVSKAGMRVQARLVTQNSSPFTLDDPASVEQMLAQAKASDVESGPKKKRSTK